MKAPALRLLPLLLFFYLLAPLQAQEKGATPLAPLLKGPGGRLHAVVVGISDYQDDAIPDLRFADRDAEAFANFLRSPAGGTLDGDHLKVLTNERATAGRIAEALDGLLEQVKEGDQVIIYFSGHGDVERKTVYQPGFLLAWDAPSRVYMGGGTYSLAFLQEVVTTLSTQNLAKVTVITDACHAGKLAGNQIGGAQLTSANLAKQYANEVKILSCQPNEFSLEGEQWGGGRGVFSYHLVDGLFGLADRNGDGTVTVGEIDRYLEDHVTAEAAPQSQVPMLLGNKTERLATVSAAILAELKKAKTSGMSVFTATESRGLEDEVLAKLDSGIVEKYFAFKKAVAEKRFFPDSSAANPQPSADELYASLSAEPGLAPLHGFMKRNYAAALQDDAQQVMNGWLKSDQNTKTVSKKKKADRFHQYPRYLERAASLLGEQHYMYPILWARKLFFEGYLLILYDNKKDIERGTSALSLFREALHWQPDLPQAWWQMSKVFAYNFEMADSAEHCARMAMELNPAWATPAISIAYCLQSRFGKLEESLYYLEYAARLDSASVDVLEGRAGYHFVKQEWDKAIALFNECAQKQPDDPVHYHNLGLSLSYSGRNSEAVPVFLKSIEVDSTFDVSYMGLSVTYAYLGDFEKAEAYGKRAIEIDPDAGVNYYGFACTLAIIGKHERAFEVLEKSLTMGDETYNYEWLQFDPDLTNIRSLPQWKPLMKKYFPNQAKD